MPGEVPDQAILSTPLGVKMFFGRSRREYTTMRAGSSARIALAGSWDDPLWGGSLSPPRRRGHIAPSAMYIKCMFGRSIGVRQWWEEARRDNAGDHDHGDEVAGGM
jgi:hypothetical protein